MENIVEANRKGDLYLTDETHVYYFPQDWCDHMQDAVDHEDGPEIYGYAPLFTTPDSDVDTMWVLIAQLESMREVTESEARNIHPALFRHLQAINAGVL